MAPPTKRLKRFARRVVLGRKERVRQLREEYEGAARASEKMGLALERRQVMAGLSHAHLLGRFERYVEKLGVKPTPPFWAALREIHVRPMGLFVAYRSALTGPRATKTELGRLRKAWLAAEKTRHREMLAALRGVEAVIPHALEGASPYRLSLLSGEDTRLCEMLDWADAIRADQAADAKAARMARRLPP